MRCAILALSACSLLSTGVEGRAGDEIAWRVSQRAGTLASTTEDGRWRVAHMADALPAECRLRTAGDGPSTLRAGGATLHLAPLSRASVDAAQRSIVVERGRALLDVDDGEAWSLQAGDVVVQLPVGAAAHAAIVGAASGAVAVVRGSGTARRRKAG